MTSIVLQSQAIGLSNGSVSLGNTTSSLASNGYLPSVQPTPFRIAVRTTEFIKEIEKKILRYAQDLDVKALKDVLWLVSREGVTPIQDTLLKKSGYFARWFSNESWEDWLEYRTPLGKVVSMYCDHITTAQTVKASISRLDKKLLEIANQDATTILKSLRVEEEFTKDQDEVAFRSFWSSFLSLPMAEAAYQRIVQFPVSSDTTDMRAIYPVTIETLQPALIQIGYSQEEVKALIDKTAGDTPLLTDLFYEKAVTTFDQLSRESFDEHLLSQLRDSRGRTFIQAAIEDGTDECVKKILITYKGTSIIHTVDSKGKNALHIASIFGKSSLIELLTSEGINVNEEDRDGLTPLHWAIHEGKTETVRALIQQGASLDKPWALPGNVKRYPLEMAIVAGDPTVLITLLDKDPFQKLDLSHPVHGIGNLLHLAIRSNQAPMLEHLLSKHAEKVKSLFSQKDPEGRTPLQLAAFLGDLYAIRLLHAHKVDFNQGADQEGGTAVHYAARGEQPEAIRLLDWLGAPLQSLDDMGRSPVTIVEGEKTLSAKKCKGLLLTLPKIEKIEKTEPPNYKRRPPFNLVIQGGGPKGIAYLGAIERMETLGTLSELKRVAGTSAGAITAAFLSVGCKAEDLRVHIGRDLGGFLDANGELEASLLQAAQSRSYQDSIKALLRAYWGGWSTLLNPLRRLDELREKIQNLNGLASGEKLRVWIEGIIREKTGKVHCTFGELQELIHENPQKYKELHVFSICISTWPDPKIVRFSHEDEKWKDLIISDAIRASLSIPGVFQPHTLHFKDATGTRHAREHHGQFIDGGLIRNFPIDAFDDEKYQEDRHFRGEKTNRRTLGLGLFDPKPSAEPEIQEISSGSDIIKALISTFYHAEQIMLDETGRYRDRTILIPVTGVGLLDFNLSDEAKALHIGSGTKATDSFFLI